MVSALMGAAGQAGAVSITVLNASFENPALSPGQFTNAPIPNWVGSAFRGVFFPGVPSDVSFVPDGNQVAYIFGAGTISQDLGVAVQAGVPYQLNLWVGTQSGFAATYLVQLVAGGSSTVIASDTAALPGSGVLLPVSISGLGAGTGNLTVVLTSVNGQPLFDLVQVSSSQSSAAPEPASITGLILGLAALGWVQYLRPIVERARLVPVPNRVSPSLRKPA
jgi:hypothetical protein